tara:strand:- start:240 stop:1271 length:1032 start_codon:yes stop_codon:yes gene_type:complete
MKFFLGYIFIILCFPCFLSCAQGGAAVESKLTKINGVSFVAARDTVNQTHIDPIVRINANYAAIMPFGFIKNLDHPEIIHNTERQWFGETRSGAKQYIDHLHRNKIKVMVKPQIWIWRGEFTGHLKMNSEEDWKDLEEAYRSFILEYAALASEAKVEIFCVGTELEQFIVHRPEYWTQLISEIKKVFHGKLTYAANWDEYKRVPFWEDLDYIGVDAYFPVCKSKDPTIEECKQGWQKWINEMEGVSEREGKKILFAEYGYRSIDYSGKEPWDSDHARTGVNMEAQVTTMQALYEEVWDRDWFAGGFIWKWFIHHPKVGGIEDAFFTPQNKPTEELIKKVYGAY